MLKPKVDQCVRVYKDFLTLAFAIREEVYEIEKNLTNSIRTTNVQDFRKIVIDLNSIRTLPGIQKIIDPIIRKLLETADLLERGGITPGDARKYVQGLLRDSLKKMIGTLDSYATLY